MQHSLSPNFNSLDKTASEILRIAHKSSRKLTFDHLLIALIKLRGCDYVHIIDFTGLHVAPVFFCKVVSPLCLSLCACPDLFIMQRKTEKKKLYIKYQHLSSPKGRLHTSFSLLSSAESPKACGITQFRPHLQHLAVSCCLAVGHNVPAVAVGDETAICCQESHFALRKNRPNRGRGSRLETCKATGC